MANNLEARVSRQLPGSTPAMTVDFGATFHWLRGPHAKKSSTPPSPVLEIPSISGLLQGSESNRPSIPFFIQLLFAGCILIDLISKPLQTQLFSGVVFIWLHPRRRNTPNRLSKALTKLPSLPRPFRSSVLQPARHAERRAAGHIGLPCGPMAMGITCDDHHESSAYLDSRTQDCLGDRQP